MSVSVQVRPSVPLSGSGSTWQSIWFGTKGLQVQILSSRPFLLERMMSMEIGKRNFYVIMRMTTWDGTDGEILFITQNHLEAAKRFKWLYEKDVYRDFLNEEEEPTYEDRNYNININDNDKKNIIVSGNFWYSDCDGSCDYVLRTLKTNHFFIHNTASARMEERYNNDI